MKSERSSLVRQTALLALTLAVLPVLFYPHRLGLGRLQFAPIYLLAEWGFYLLLFLFMLPRVVFVRKVIASGGTVLVRLAVGGTFGFFVSLTNPVGLGNATSQGLWEYVPALALHILLVPFVLRPWWMAVYGAQPAKRTVIGFGKPASEQDEISDPDAIDSILIRRPKRPSARAAAAAASPRADINGTSFQSAVDYLGDYHDVRLCWLIDGDGLVVASWQRQRYTGDADFWGALTLEMARYHERVLSMGESVTPSRIEVRTEGGKLIVEGMERLWLGVLTGPDADELLNVRLAQAEDMITRHYRERYSKTTSGEREAAYA